MTGTIEQLGWVAFTVGLLAGLMLAVLTVPDTAGCHEDEAAVWVDDGHDACVALDDMWWDADTGTVHWFTTDQRPSG